jgi:hypothetical protein
VKTLKAYVGLHNRFVMCERFPDDEEHGGLNEMLEEFVDFDSVLTDEDMEQGFYMLEFDIEQDRGLYDGPSDPYLVVTKMYPCKI